MKGLIYKRNDKVNRKGKKNKIIKQQNEIC